MKLTINQSANSFRQYTRQMVEEFSRLSGDKNPIHLSEDHARESIFGKPIVHGFLVSAQISELIASTLPGPGSIYIGQNLRFLHPVYHGDTIKCLITITDIDSKKNNVALSTVCINQDEVTVLSGTAFIKQPNLG